MLAVSGGIALLVILALNNKVKNQQKQIQIINAEKSVLGSKVNLLECTVTRQNSEISRLNVQIDEFKKSRK